MCLIVFAWRPGHSLPLVVAANRDEFHARPSAPLGRWADAPGVLAGRDIETGGTWMGVGPGGRFAAVTNIRDPAQPLGAISRGTLPAAFLRGEWPAAAYLDELAGRCERYTGFNLLVSDGRQLGYLNARDRRPTLLGAGVYSLSNDRLNSPWPKQLKALSLLREHLAEPSPQALLALLADREQPADAQLPSTGVPLEWERQLSSIFITGQDYGTRTSTVLLQHADGRRQLIERSFGPHGVARGDLCFDSVTG